MSTTALFMMAAVVGAIVIGVLWIALPFAVFGIKTRLDKLISQNEELLEIRRET